MGRLRSMFTTLQIVLLGTSASLVPSPAVAQRQLEEERARAIELYGVFSETFESLDRAAAPDVIGPGISARTSEMLFRLQTLTAADRYAVLKTWTLMGAPQKIRCFSGFLKDPPPPSVFQREPMPPIDDPLVSTAEMLVQAAREAGKLDELANELADLKDWTARSLWLLVELERGNAEAVRPVLNELVDQRGGGGFRPPIQSQLLDGLVVKAAIRHSQTRDLGLRLHNTALFTAKGSANFSLIVWLYRLGGLAAIASVEGASLGPSSDPGLKHWIPTDLSSAGSNNTFGGTSWWVAAEDRIGHVSSPYIDHLEFAYPLTGAFEISCEPFNGLWAEGNVGFGGLMVEAWNQGSGNNQIYPHNQHEVIVGPKPAERRDQFNPVTIRVQPDKFHFLGVNDEILYQGVAPSPTSPFLVLRTTWLCAFRNIRITGNPVIPRELALLSGDLMDGWISSFYNESQPPALTLGQPQPGVSDGVVTRSDDPNWYDWNTINGVLHGRRFPDLKARQSGFEHGESWLYYHRPLREGERISYEFFYKPDEKIEAHPTLDRIALLLHPDGVKLHWLTTNRAKDDLTGWIATENVIEEPACRRGPTPLPLKPDAWNSAVLEIRGGKVRIELNGQLIYERLLELSLGTRFGVYHDRENTSARVRNVVLTGDWPEWSPELAANLLERRFRLSPADEQAIRTILEPLTLRDAQSRGGGQ